MHTLQENLHHQEHELGALRSTHKGTCNDLNCKEEECLRLKQQLQKLKEANKKLQDELFHASHEIKKLKVLDDYKSRITALQK